MFRSYFKAADRYRSESMNATPRIRFRTEEEVNDSYSRGNQNRKQKNFSTGMFSKFKLLDPLKKCRQCFRLLTNILDKFRKQAAKDLVFMRIWFTTFVQNLSLEGLSQFVPGKINSRFTEVFNKEREDGKLHALDTFKGIEIFKKIWGHKRHQRRRLSTWTKLWNRFGIEINQAWKSSSCISILPKQMKIKCWKKWNLKT